CMRRAISANVVRTSEGAQRVVEAWQRMAAEEGVPLGLFDLRLLVLGAWRAQRHALIPHLYRAACALAETAGAVAGAVAVAGPEAELFRKLSAIVMSFYVREHGSGVKAAAIKGLLEDLNQRQIRLSPSHYAMLVLYFGKAGNMPEALRVLGRAMEDPEAAATEALYCNTFRAFACCFARMRRERSGVGSGGVGPAPGCTGDAELGSTDGADLGSTDGADLGYIDAVDADLDRIGAGPTQHHHQHQPLPSAAAVSAAATCTRLFQTMASREIPAGFRTYRELIGCLVEFGMADKARRVFEFAVEGAAGGFVPSDFVLFYVRRTTRSPHEMHLALRHALRTVPGLLAAMQAVPGAVLADRFGVFNGDLRAFMACERRPAAAASVSLQQPPGTRPPAPAPLPPAGGRGGAFLTQFMGGLRRATRAAVFVNCLMAGNDAGGRFKGFNFPKLGSGAVEAEVAAACGFLARERRGWLLHRDIIHALLPVVPGMAVAADEPEELRFVRRLGGCRTAGSFVALLERGCVEGYDIALVNQVLRTQMGLTFQAYARLKAAGHARLFWPSFMYTQASGWTDAPLYGASAGAGGLGAAAVRESWAFLAARLHGDASSDALVPRLAPDANTVGIMSKLAAAAGDRALGQRIWDDVFRAPPAAAAAAAEPVSRPPLLQGVRIYKHYLCHLSGSPGGGAHARHAFGDSALALMFATMGRNSVQPTPGLLCQALRVALELGQLDVAAALEQWQLHRERVGKAPAGFLQGFFAARELPELPARATSVLALVRGPATGCPRLSQYIAKQIH
ncbi:hypothetical protein LPJ66_008896, partial [Kickxella alabastrina]